MQEQQALVLEAVLGVRQKGQTRLPLDFWSPSCGMCKNMTPVIKELMVAPALTIIEQDIIREIRLGVKNRARVIKMLETRQSHVQPACDIEGRDDFQV